MGRGVSRQVPRNHPGAASGLVVQDCAHARDVRTEQIKQQIHGLELTAWKLLVMAERLAS